MFSLNFPQQKSLLCRLLSRKHQNCENSETMNNTKEVQTLKMENIFQCIHPNIFIYMAVFGIIKFITVAGLMPNFFEHLCLFIQFCFRRIKQFLSQENVQIIFLYISAFTLTSVFLNFILKEL